MENMKDTVTITFSRTGESGNIFWIIRALLHEYRQRGMSLEEFKPIFDRITACHSYEDALNVVREYATLIEEE